MTTKRIEFIPKPFFHENFYDIKNLYPTPQILHETQTLSPYLESTTFSNYNSTSSTLNSTASSNSSEILETAKNFNANLVLPWPSEVLGLVKNSTTASSLMTCSKKIVLIGDQAVGKTTLLKKYSKNVIDLNYKATIGIDFECLKYNILNVPFTIQVWDTAGQERFRAMSSQYYRKAQLVMITADASNTESIDNILMWDQHLKNNVDEYEKLLKIVVLTKIDLINDSLKNNTYDSVNQISSKIGAEVWPVSSTLDINVKYVFNRAVSLIFLQNCYEELYLRQKNSKHTLLLIKNKKLLRDPDMLNTSEMEEFERELEMENADQAGDPESNPSSKSSASNMQPTNSKFEPYQNYDPNHEPGNYSPRFLASNRKTIHLTQSDVVSLQKSPTHSSMNDSSEQPASGFFRSWFNCF